VQLDPAEIFPRVSRTYAAAPEKVFLMMSHDEPAIRVDATDPRDIARRMIASNLYEQQPLLATYLAYQFAFPGRRSELMERAPALQAEILADALADKDAFVVRHPYPCDLGALFDAMAPSCARARPPVPREAAVAGPTPAAPAGWPVGGRA
jgi:hypothetical protein